MLIRALNDLIGPFNNNINIPMLFYMFLIYIIYKSQFRRPINNPIFTLPHSNRVYAKFVQHLPNLGLAHI